MHLGVSKSKNSTSLYVIKSTYDNGFHSTKIVEKLGTVKELEKTLNGEDPIVWAKRHIAELNKAEKTHKHDVTTKYSSRKLIAKDVQRSLNGGYLFLKQIYNDFGFPKICHEIEKKYHLEFDFNAVFSRLVFSRIIFPTSRLPYYDSFCMFIEQPSFQKEDVTTTLQILAKERVFLKEQIYEAVRKNTQINTGVLFYDTTMCLYEPMESSSFKPNIPFEIYFDGNMTPLTYRYNPKHKKNLEPSAIESEIQKNFSHSHVISTSDSRITSGASRTFKDWKMPNSYIMTVRLDHLHDDERALIADTKNWISWKTHELTDITKIKRTEEIHNPMQFYYKEIVKGDHRTIVAYSAHLDEWNRLEHDYHSASQFIFPSVDSIAAGIRLNNPSYYGGITAITTNLEYEPEKIIEIARLRAQANLSLRMLSMELQDFNSSLNEEIVIDAHFVTCFSALVIYSGMLNQFNLHEQATEAIQELRNMNFMKIAGEGYVPLYTRNDITDALHEAAGFHTDYEIINSHYMNALLKK